ncbi:hypothetical protein Aph01nite_53900 [Acrocarpospora phusangensis]|uniref:Radical SAM core domain-containing protein n=1 Tax=Acrocarpospora phusangensis TaxID=1070424 RepID=A0A919UT41_9ACTN|nr:FxsB family cyclophane-forming radical SAM/SPASM peptide maturase [Acrocarpospora phusangensis]GIH27080.1 hypothetical protein Aph01nite_53900 [Acrocarpospora phusangensis]
MSDETHGQPQREWPATLAIGDLLAGGWQPVPFRQFILKIHSRCNLACDYCYMYELADQSWRDRPKLMAPRHVTATAHRIAEHARDHKLRSARVILHGGEPLLAGPEYISDLVHEIRAATSGVAVDFIMQTNGVRLTESFLRVLLNLGVRIGVSLDGGERDNDRHRKTRTGRGSYATVARALRLLGRPEFQPVYGGILCTVDLANDPVGTYESLAAFKPPAIDLLLPHGTWADPPPGWTGDPGHTPYADWLIAVFDRWYGEGNPPVGVRLFEEIIHLLLGGRSGVEAVGLTPSTLVVVETDGTIEQSDFLKVVGQGAAATGLNVVEHAFDRALFHPGVAVRQLGLAGLAEQCQTCRFGQVCGGGLYAHRYRPGSGHLNPSVYCADLFRLITHIRARLVRDLPAE